MVILARAQLPEAAGLLKGATPDQRGRDNRVISRPEVVEREAAAKKLSLLAVLATDHYRDPRVCRFRQLAFQLGRKPEVVGIEECEPHAPCLAGAAVSRLPAARVRLPQQPYDGTKALDDRRCSVLRAVIDHDDLFRRARLDQYAFNRCRNGGRCVVSRDNHRKGHRTSMLDMLRSLRTVL